MKRIGISTDCMCNLPENVLTANDVSVMRFYIHTATGRFISESEITTDNILEYFEEGDAVARYNVPEPEECRAYFEALLERYDEVIHITASEKIGLSYPNARAALELMGEEQAARVTLVNSGSFSAGIGHMALLAVALRDEGKDVAEIASACSAARRKISSAFIVPDAECLYRMGYVGRALRGVCEVLRLHPVLWTKNGKISLKGLRMGSYQRAVVRFVRSELRSGEGIDKKRLFITHAGCSEKTLAQIRAEADSLCGFETTTVAKASAVITSCTGPRAVGIQFIRQ